MSILVLPQSMVADRDAHIKANAQHVDDNFDALASAVNGKLDLDGSSTPTANIPMGNHKLTNVATPTLSGDAATKGYVDNADTSLSNTISTLDNAVVKLAGSQTITGDKYFSGNLIKKSATDDYTVAPGSTVGTSITLFDKNNQHTGGFEHYHYSDGSTISRVSTRQQNSNNYSVLDVGVTASGTQYTSAPACDLANSIVTTLNTQKAQIGYFKLGNGLIVQWLNGYVTTQNATINLPTAFSSGTSYSVVATRAQNVDDVYSVLVGNMTSTSIALIRHSGMGSGMAYNIIAIGY